MILCLSHVQAAPLVRARAAGAAAEASPDLGLSTVSVALTAEGVVWPGGVVLRWAEVERIAKSETKCFAVEADGEVREIRVFSEATGWVRSLYPTSGAPTMLVSGLPMHRIKDTEPMRDTLAKIAAIAPITGRVLDTATGLGYTAIEAARSATEVVTIELDPAGLEITRDNPWSRDLFANPRIQQIVGDAVEVLPELPAGHFDRVIHDPPMFNLAGELYATDFYRELHRVLRSGGRLFHYIGDPASPSGSRTTASVLRRLGEAGFRDVRRAPAAFGVTARR